SATAGAMAGRYDLGPAWIWPHNHRVLQMARALDLSVVEQYATGKLVFEARDGQIRRDLDHAPMAGALRLAGGLGGLVERLAAGLDPARLLTGQRVIGIDGPAGALRIALRGPSGAGTVMARRAALALPPRLAGALGLPEDQARALSAVPTWMAGQAKIIAVYPGAPWRAAGLSGSAISHRGPLVEIHDATAPPAGDTVLEGALFGFVGTPAAVRAADPAGLIGAATDQLHRLFPDLPAPTAVRLQDWALEPETATPAVAHPPAGHPVYGPLRAQRSLEAAGIWLAGSEVAPEEGGFVEGALAAAEAAAGSLLASLSTAHTSA
ncbi:MAG: FAD-dependent oxidoreductase, partial [Pseudomonadota bacterium]